MYIDLEGLRYLINRGQWCKYSDVQKALPPEAQDNNSSSLLHSTIVPVPIVTAASWFSLGVA